MTRSILLGAASAAALMLSSVASAATHPSMSGGGSTLAEFDYFKEFTLYNSKVTSPTGAKFNNPDGDNANDTLYWPSGSGAGQTAFLNDDLTCDANKVTGADGKNCAGGILETIYGASDATLSSAQISAWSSSATGQSVAGNLIQLPSMGVGISIPTVNNVVANGGSVTANGQVSLTDSDLCGIFSGKITNWSTIAAESYNKGKHIAPGTISVVYRADGSGTSFLLTDHLMAVCNSSNSNITFTATTTFANLFLGTTTGKPPANFYGENGSSGVASYLSGLASSNSNPAFSGQGVGYLSPDFTTIDPSSDAVLSNGAKSALVVAGVKLGTKFILPTTTNITTALAHPGILNPTGAQNPPTTAQAAAQTTAFVPLLETVTQGYPIVGYTTFDLAQCYTNANISAGVINFFLKAHYHTAAYLTDQKNNGFVGISNSGAAKYLAAITTYIQPGSTDYGTEIGSASGCAGKTGR